jgi:hypothetical protein
VLPKTLDLSTVALCFCSIVNVNVVFRNRCFYFHLTIEDSHCIDVLNVNFICSDLSCDDSYLLWGIVLIE